MTQTPEEIFKVMNASRILVAILTKLKSIDIPAQVFIDSNNEDKQLSVNYNDETNSFEFKLKQEGVENTNELSND
jgi:hypothetical protein